MIVFGNTKCSWWLLDIVTLLYAHGILAVGPYFLKHLFCSDHKVKKQVDWRKPMSSNNEVTARMLPMPLFHFSKLKSGISLGFHEASEYCAHLFLFNLPFLYHFLLFSVCVLLCQRNLSCKSALHLSLVFVLFLCCFPLLCIQGMLDPFFQG